mmetsp:Transcript_2674/g.7101  ORF Transcript_2674/g.7101 Transcript_2674/m.7101 type:complete len:234 (+) Transcript_2674:372-1073(+)
MCSKSTRIGYVHSASGIRSSAATRRFGVLKKRLSKGQHACKRRSPEPNGRVSWIPSSTAVPRRERRRARHGARGSAGGPRHSIWQAGPAGARARAARQLRVGIAAEGEAAGVLGDAADEVLVLVALVAARPPEVRQGCEHAVQRGTTPAALPTEAGLLGLVLAPSLAVRRHLPGVRVRGAHLALVVRARSLVCCQRVEINDGLGAQLRRHGTLQMAARRERSKHTQVQWKDLC